MIKHILKLTWNKKKQNFLLFLEIFLAFLILYAVFTFCIYNYRIFKTPMGFDTENIWIAELNFRDMTDTLALTEMKERLYRDIADDPAIESVAFMGQTTPLGGSNYATGNDDNGFELFTHYHEVDENFAKTMGLELIEGRWFNKDDYLEKYPPVIITSKMAAESFKDRAYMDSVYVFQGEKKIIGVVGHNKYNGQFTEEKPVSFFFNDGKNPWDMPSLLMRLKPNPSPDLEQRLFNKIVSTTKTTDFNIRNLENDRIRSNKDILIPMIAMLSICGFLILNVALGLFGVLWNNVSKRKPEIGLRRTLGASVSNVSTQFVSEVVVVSLGAILFAGIFAIQLPLLKVMEIETSNYLYGALAALGIILFIVLICSFYPAYQGARIHPAVALHDE